MRTPKVSRVQSYSQLAPNNHSRPDFGSCSFLVYVVLDGARQAYLNLHNFGMARGALPGGKLLYRARATNTAHMRAGQIFSNSGRSRERANFGLLTVSGSRDFDLQDYSACSAVYCVPS